jgi:hypothetical protein
MESDNQPITRTPAVPPEVRYREIPAGAHALGEAQ